MLDKEIILKIVEDSFTNVVEKNKSFSFEEEFIGSNTRLESIEIVQVISYIEENLEKKGIKGFDLFEYIYEFETLTFDKLAVLIEENINTN